MSATTARDVAASFRHIACCIDRSAAADAGLAEAVRLSGILGARLSLVHVASPPLGTAYSRWGPAHQIFFAEAGDWLSERAAAVPGAEPVLLWGFAAERVCDWAADADADLLVAAAHTARCGARCSQLHLPPDPPSPVPGLGRARRRGDPQGGE
jgi:hypothetical protein